ncbi:hypothetical protein WUBG_07453, partial [Wuchereria bancrofti]
VCRKISMEMQADEDNGSNSKYAICDVDLSKIISFENVRRSLVDRTAGALLRPISCTIVIDGPLIGVSYDQNYAMNDHICLENYVGQMKATRKIRRGFKIMKPYPVQALVKILFYFIARGHKTTAFLPVFFNEWLDESCCSRCALISNVEQFHVTRWKKILQVEKPEVSASEYRLLVNEQLMLQTQFRLLSKLASMLDDHFPCGPSDADIVPLFRHTLGFTDETTSSAKCYLRSRPHDSLQRYLRSIYAMVVRIAIATNIIGEVPCIVTNNFYTPNFIRPRKPQLKISRSMRVEFECLHKPLYLTYSGFSRSQVTTVGGTDVLKSKFCPVLTTHFIPEFLLYNASWEQGRPLSFNTNCDYI